MSDLKNLQDELAELEDTKEEIEFNLEENNEDNEFYTDEDDFKDWKKRARFALMKTKQRIRHVNTEIREFEKEEARRDAEAKQKQIREEGERKRQHQKEQREAHQRLIETKAKAHIEAREKEAVRQDMFNENFVSLAKSALDHDVYISIAREAQQLIND